MAGKIHSYFCRSSTETSDERSSTAVVSSSIVVSSSYDESDDSGSEETPPRFSTPSLSPETAPPPKRTKRPAKHRRSGFDQAWCKEFSWLEVVRNEGGSVIGMMCCLCREHGKVPRSGSKVWLTSPCMSLRKDKLVAHSKTSVHKAAKVAYAEQQQSRQTGGIPQAFENAITCERQAIIGCCKCIYWLCKRELPHTTTYASLLTLVENLGCQYFEALRVGQNATYTSPQIAGEFLTILDGMIKEKVLNEIRQSDTYSIMIDESTDISILKQLVCYVRCVAIDGKLKTHFLMIADLPDGKADTITITLTQYLSKHDLSIDKMSSFGSDGAPVMTGCFNGVVAQLKQLNNHIISVHCVCHRLALACGQAGNSITYLKRVKESLLTLWKYFHYSPVKSANLRQIQEEMASPELKLTLVKACDTRWLSHKAAVTTLLRCLPAVLVTLRNEKNPTAVGLHKTCGQYMFVAALQLLSEALAAVNRLSLAFQRALVDLSVIRPLLISTNTTLQKLKDESPSAFEKKINSLIKKMNAEASELKSQDEDSNSVSVLSEEESSDEEPSGDEEVHITCTSNAPQRFESHVRQKFLSRVIENIQERFPQAELLEAFSILDPQGV